MMSRPVLKRTKKHDFSAKAPPENPNSATTLEQYRDAFADFDGVHWVPNPIYIRPFLRTAITTAADPDNEEVSMLAMKHDRESNRYDFVEKPKFMRRGDLQVICATPDVMKDLCHRWGGQITKDSRDVKGQTVLRNPHAPHPDFFMALEAGFEVLAWRVYGWTDKHFMDTDGYVISGMDALIAGALDIV